MVRIRKKKKKIRKKLEHYRGKIEEILKNREPENNINSQEFTFSQEKK